jgi:hypothetical protein
MTNLELFAELRLSFFLILQHFKNESNSEPIHQLIESIRSVKFFIDVHYLIVQHTTINPCFNFCNIAIAQFCSSLGHFRITRRLFY